MSNEKNPICVYCNAPYTKEMMEVYNGTYGCDTGCEYVTIKVICDSCKKVVYEKGYFGAVEGQEERDDEWGDVVDENRKSS